MQITTTLRASMSSDDLRYLIRDAWMGILRRLSKATLKFCETAIVTAILAGVNLLMSKTCTSKALVEMGIPAWKAFVVLAHAFEKDPDERQINLGFWMAVSFLLGAFYLERTHP